MYRICWDLNRSPAAPFAGCAMRGCRGIGSLQRTAKQRVALFRCHACMIRLALGNGLWNIASRHLGLAGRRLEFRRGRLVVIIVVVIVVGTRVIRWL